MPTRLSLCSFFRLSARSSYAARIASSLQGHKAFWEELSPIVSVGSVGSNLLVKGPNLPHHSGVDTLPFDTVQDKASIILKEWRKTPNSVISYSGYHPYAWDNRSISRTLGSITKGKGEHVCLYLLNMRFIGIFQSRCHYNGKATVRHAIPL